MNALQPSLFPDLDGAMFYPDDLLDEVAADVLRIHGRAPNGLPRLIPVAEAIENGEVRVLFLMNGKPLKEGDDPTKHTVAGRCMKAPPVWHDVTGYDIAIWIRGTIWEEADEHLRRALVLHELLHVEVARDKNDQPLVAVRKHDVEDFVDVARHYGPIAGDGAGYVRAAAAYAGHPEPLRPTRPADVAAIVDAVAELPIEEQVKVHDAVEAVSALHELAAETGTDITITHRPTNGPERSATIRGRKAKADVQGSDAFGGLLRRGEALSQARDRLEQHDVEALGTEGGQQLLEALADGRGAEVPWPAAIEDEA